jgi:hypothetical protein
LSIESLKQNKALLNFLDDALTVHLEDYLQNPIVKNELKLNREKVIKLLGLSEKFFYDFENDTIKLRSKPKRRVLVLRDVSKESQNEQAIKKLFETSGEKHYDKLIHKVERASTGGDLFYVYFENEEITVEIFRWIEKRREEKIDVIKFLIITHKF